MLSKDFRKKRAVVFDLDGTILDTIADIAAALNRALDAFGYKSRTVAEVTGFLGNGSLMLIRRATGEYEDDDLCNAVRARFREEYESHMYDLTVPYNGICDLLSDLSENGIEVAVVTNKDDRCAVPMIRHYFGDSVRICRGVRGDNDRKPNPSVTLSVIKDLGVTPDEALFVGDGMADLNVAKNCGIEFIPVGYGYTDSGKLFAECSKSPVADVNSLRRELFKYF